MLQNVSIFLTKVHELGCYILKFVMISTKYTLIGYRNGIVTYNQNRNNRGSNPKLRRKGNILSLVLCFIIINKILKVCGFLDFTLRCKRQ